MVDPKTLQYKEARQLFSATDRNMEMWSSWNNDDGANLEWQVIMAMVFATRTNMTHMKIMETIVATPEEEGVQFDDPKFPITVAEGMDYMCYHTGDYANTTGYDSTKDMFLSLIKEMEGRKDLNLPWVK